MNIVYDIKIKCKVDVHFGISLKKDKIYNARDCGRGWFALIDETNEEYAYPPRLFEVVEDSIKPRRTKTAYVKPSQNKLRTDFPNIAAAGK